MAARAQGGSNRTTGVTSNGYGVSFGGDESVQKLVVMLVNILKPLNYTLERGEF